MLPSLLAREIQNGLKHFLRTGFEPSDPLFAGVMQRFTEDEARWMKGPYLQLGLPFRTGKYGKTFFGSFETEHPGHIHQEAAWQRLSSKRMAAGTLVATGTGSGKTECFLYPVLDYCARATSEAAEGGQPGIKALVIYPMNALATDQARRFAHVIAQTPAFKGLRVGLFVGGRAGKDGRGLPTMTASSVITDRETLRMDPPDILLTNYKMLDYLLIRPKDRQLWAKNTAETLRYVVVDELHTFDGAQGTDLALLLRRLRARLKTPDGHLICTGTSATLGANTDTAPLCEYARQVFGVDFPPESVVTENRLTETEFLGEGTIVHVLYPPRDISEFVAVLDADQYPTQQAAVSAWFTLFFPGLDQPGDVNDLVWRSALGGLLKKHLLFVNLLKLLKGQIVSLAELQQQMQGPLPEGARPHIGKVLDALLVLVAWARDPAGRPLVTLRVQLWMRELRRMVSQVRGDAKNIELRTDSDVKREPGKLFLPVLQCAECHTSGWLSRMPSGQSRVSTDLDEIYNTWFSGQPEALRLYSFAGLSRPLCDGVAQRLCSQCGHLQSGTDQCVDCVACGHAELVEVFRVTATRNTTTKGGVTHAWHDPTCPACGSKFRQILLGARNTTLGAVTIEQSWASPFNDDKKLIAFSDSVQDAAHRAGFFTARTYLNTVRTGLAQVIDQVADAHHPQCAWTTFLDQAASLWLAEGSPLAMPVERFVSEFIGPNMMWQADWAKSLQEQGRLPKDSRLPGRVQKRLAWQAFAEFTYRSRRGRTLDTIGKATLAPRLADLVRVADRLLPVLHETFGIRHADQKTVVQWLWGFACHLRQRGAVAHPDLMTYARDGNIYAFTHTQGRSEWLPGMGERTPHPIFLSLGKERGFDHLVNPQAATFFQTWLSATLGANGLLPRNAEQPIYTEAINVLVDEAVLLRIEAQPVDVIALNPAALVLETQLVRLVSAQGKRGLTVPADSADILLGMPCLDAPQETYSEKVEAVGWLSRRFSRGDLRRVFSAEHTGLLQREQREALEQRFKARPPQPWYENLLSATPTLEMGVDIGDLSSVLLCSVPPNQASYLQRIGRAGRRDGNEAGVELKSLLWRKKGSDDPDNAAAYISLPTERYERPAQSALSEFAPENVFYANQRRVEIDQINISLSSFEMWRMCPTCQHMENLEIHADSHGTCPRCKDPMWANTSQKRQLLRFKQAIANSNDTEVRIDDSAEDREPKFYMRQMLADFEVKDITEAYRLKCPDLPFGFEFIERVVFRDVNFGEPTKPGEAYAVAGQQKARPGFKLCKHCGQIQRAPRNAREREQAQFHAFDCEKRGSDDPTNIIDCLYLYREFSSEALRILVPYTSSGVDEASVQSFMAAVRIGLKKRFGGKVDHLRMVTQEERGQEGAASRQYVMLYDSVPGGTGYLHELLANDAKVLIEILRLALTHLAACSCNADAEKDGCYRCVYQFRLGRAMALVSRDRARAILEQLVGNLDQLERVATIADIYINPNFDSELEARFIESLRRLSGQGGLPFVKLVQDIVQGKSGYLLEVGEQRYWIEPQVDLDPDDGVKVPCRPDFVLWPTQSRSQRRPIAVFCDGWAYHQASTREDANKRSAVVASGKFWVWSVTWEDVRSAMDGKLETNLADALEAMCFNQKGQLPPPLRSMLDDNFWTQHAVAVLLHWLGKPIGEGADLHASKLARHAGASAFRMVPNPGNAALDEARNKLVSFWDGMDLPCERPDQSVACGNVNDRSLTLRYWWPRELLNPGIALQPSPGFVIFNDAYLQDEPERHLIWRRWLWLFNVFQTLPGVLLATKEGLDASDHSALTIFAGSRPGPGAQAVAHAAAWEAVIEQAMVSLADGLHALMDAGLLPPDEVGYELEKEGEVVAEAELAWVERKLVLLMPAHSESGPVWEADGWKTVMAEGEWQKRLADELGC